MWQHGILAWTGFHGFANYHAVFWLMPVMSFSVVVGIALDYDIFILVRIREQRAAGKDNRTAIITGLTRTGGIITAAGVIMTIAFSGLLFSSTPMLNMLACYLVSTVRYIYRLVSMVMFVEGWLFVCVCMCVTDG